MQKTTLVLAMFSVCAVAQPPHKMFIAGSNNQGFMVTPPGPISPAGTLIPYTVDEPKIVGKMMHKRCADLATQVFAAPDAEMVLVLKNRGAELRAKDGEVLYTTNVRSEVHIARDVCAYLAAH